MPNTLKPYRVTSQSAINTLGRKAIVYFEESERGKPINVDSILAELNVSAAPDELLRLEVIHVHVKNPTTKQWYYPCSIAQMICQEQGRPNFASSDINSCTCYECRELVLKNPNKFIEPVLE